MPNSLLTPQMITREALRILHQKANFIGSINRQYDDSFAKPGAKIGQTLRVRLPNQYVIRNGAVMVPQDTVEQYVPLTVSSQMGVDLNFSSVDLTMSLDDFSERIIAPAISVLAANIEAKVITTTVLPNVYNAVFNATLPCTLKQVLQGRKILSDALAPLDRRSANLNTQDTVDLQTDVKGLFNDQVTLGKQYKEGVIGRTSGFDFFENTLWPAFTSGAATAAYTTNTTAIPNGSSTLTVAAGAGAMVAGDTFTVAGISRVHPESKAPTGGLQRFVVTAAYAGGAGVVSISPAIYTTGPLQNVVIATNAAAPIVMGMALSTTTGTSLLYHEDAFTFATADLVMPKGVDFAARETMDGISMRIVRAFDIINDLFPCRVDVLFGAAALRPQLAVRLHNN